MIELAKGIDYDFWGNSRILEQLKSQLIPEAHRLLSHICNAQEIWLSRIHEKPAQNFDLFRIRSFDNLEHAFREQHILPKECSVDSNTDSRIVLYQNSKAESLSNALSEILFHLVIHGQHHRAQISQLIRQSGGIPLQTDYIFYLRTL